MKSKLLILALILLTLVSGFFIFLNLNGTWFLPCLEDGEFLYPTDPTFDDAACCKGLEATWLPDNNPFHRIYDGVCFRRIMSMPEPDMFPAVYCLKPCGDGICQNHENWCTCPDDCAVPEDALIVDCVTECAGESKYSDLVKEHCYCIFY